MVESAWAEDIGQFLYHLPIYTPTQDILQSLEKIELKIIYMKENGFTLKKQEADDTPHKLLRMQTTQMT